MKARKILVGGLVVVIGLPVALVVTTAALVYALDRSSISMHAADLVPDEGGPSPDPFNPLTFPAVREWTASWARRNRCTREPTESEVVPDVTRLEYTNCGDGASVVLFTIRGGPYPTRRAAASRRVSPLGADAHG